MRDTLGVSRWVIPIIVLPGTALVFVPLLIVWLTCNTGVAGVAAGTDAVTSWIAVAFGVPGAVLSVWAMSMFFRFGEGTAAPWDPPQKLVVAGPYRHVRNPMLAGVISMLIAESLFLQSWPLGIWALFFFVVNSIYFRFVEEPGLCSRFGDSYQIYCQHVGRWMPRWRPWQQPKSEDSVTE